MNMTAPTGYVWVEDTCQKAGRQIRGHLAHESDLRLTFCCHEQGCSGPRYGQAATEAPTYWTGWGPWATWPKAFKRW